MQKSLLIVFLLTLNILMSCNSEKNNDQEINTKERCYYQIDTIRSILRFTGHYEKKYNLVQNKNNVLILNGESLDLLEISWYSADSLNNSSDLVYKTELANSILIFSDYPYEIKYSSVDDTIYIENLSERNKLLLDFRTELNKIFITIQALDHRVDSIKKNQGATPKNKQNLYQQFVKSRNTINKRIDSLVYFIESINEQDVQIVASLYLLTIRPEEIHDLWNQKNWDKANLSDSILNETKEYINFRNKDNIKLPRFLEKDMNGRIVNSENLKGEYILFDFWASYCGPCIQNSVKWLLPLYDKYGSDRLEIIGVSLDQDIDRWRKTVQEKQFPWLNINCKESYSPISYLFNVAEIPRMILIDKDGYLINESITIKELKQILENGHEGTIY